MEPQNVRNQVTEGSQDLICPHTYEVTCEVIWVSRDYLWHYIACCKI
jgi:hypothetical protein